MTLAAHDRRDAERRAFERRSSDRRADDRRSAERRAIERHTTDRRRDDRRQLERRSTDRRSEERRSGPVGGGVAAERAEDGFRPPRIPARGHYTEDARLSRLAWIGDQTGVDTSAIRDTKIDAAALAGNIENFVAGIEVPVGLAGPLLFAGTDARGLITAPLATTEGVLVASVTRGATTISRAGGVRTRVIHQRMTRVPVFVFESIDAASSFGRWATAQIDDLRSDMQAVSKRARLTALDPVQIGNQLHLRFVYETGDASGQNMTTACTWRACQWLASHMAKAGHREVTMYIDGNISGDKKTNYMSAIAGRGIRAVAECVIDAATLHDVLKVTPEEMEEGASVLMAGALQIGAVGFDVNVANVVAGLFVATGQDIACVNESSVGILTVRARADGLHASLTLPSLVIGTVGGGTALPQQRTYLDLLGCAGDDKAGRLAEIITGYALALDLSTMAAVVSGQFADAHERLGRNRPVRWFTRQDVTPDLLNDMLAARAARQAGDDPSGPFSELHVTGVHPGAPLDMGSSIVTELTSHRAMQKFVGIEPLTLDVERRNQTGTVNHRMEIVLKSKALGDEVALEVARQGSLCGRAVSVELARWQGVLGFEVSHLKELHLASDPDPRMARIMPRIYGVHRDDGREAYLVAMEKLDQGILLKDTADDVSAWTMPYLEAAVTGIAGAHAAWLGTTDTILHSPWLGTVPSAELAGEMMPLWRALARYAADELPELVGADTLEELLGTIGAIPAWWPELEAMPRTLVHNDFNPRNICFRRDPGDPLGTRLVAYDWELATVHAPQRDLAELLCFTLSSPIRPGVVDHLVELHRRALEEASGADLDPAQWRRGYELCLRDFLVQRVSLYLMAHAFREHRFLPRVLRTARGLLALERGRHTGDDR